MLLIKLLRQRVDNDLVTDGWPHRGFLLGCSGWAFVSATLRRKVAGTNIAPDARADFRARGFWSRAESAFFDIRVGHPDAASYQHQTIPSLLEQQEHEKKLGYSQLIMTSMLTVEHINPLVLATSAVLRLSARFCFWSGFVLCSWRKATRPTESWCRMCGVASHFTILRSAIMCIYGSRSVYHRPVNSLREGALIEGRIWSQFSLEGWAFVSHCVVSAELGVRLQF